MLGLALLTVACGDDKKRPPIVFPDGFGLRDASIYLDGRTSDLGANPDLRVSLEGPEITIVGSAPQSGDRAVLAVLHGRDPPGQAATVGRDDEYQRLGTVSLLAGIDLYPGQIFARVEDRHRSGAFMGLLQVLDGHAPPDAIMRRVLDHHASHLSQETMAYLATRPGRFE